MPFLVTDGSRHWLSVSNLFWKRHWSQRTSVPGLKKDEKEMAYNSAHALVFSMLEVI